MCKELEELKNESFLEGESKGKREGRKEGILQNKKEIAKNMLSDGMPIELVSKYSNLSVDEVRSLNI